MKNRTIFSVLLFINLIFLVVTLVLKLNSGYSGADQGRSALADTGPMMADAMRQDGKIYVVIGVLLLIFASVAGYLIYLEKKLGKLEKEIKTKKGES